MVRETVWTTKAIHLSSCHTLRGIAKEVKSMPTQLFVDKSWKKEVYDLGIPGIILFGIPEDVKQGAHGYDCGIVQKSCQ